MIFESTTTSSLLLGLGAKPRAPGVHRVRRTTCRVPSCGWRAPAWTASPLVLPPPSLRRTLARLPHCLLAKRVPWEGVAGAALHGGLLVGFQVNLECKIRTSFPWENSQNWNSHLILVASKKPQSCRGHGDSIWYRTKVWKIFCVMMRRWCWESWSVLAIQSLAGSSFPAEVLLTREGIGSDEEI